MLHRCQKTGFALGVRGLDHFHIQVPINQGACGVAGILLPVLEAENIPELRRGSPQRSGSPRCYGNCFSQRKPRSDSF